MSEVSNTNIPASPEAEKALLGSMLINEDAYHSVAAFLKPDDFYLVRHRHVWAAMTKLMSRHEPIDSELLVEELENTGQLAAIGGRSYLVELGNSTPTSVHAEFYGRLVQKTAQRRRIMKAADEIKALAADESLNIGDVQAGAFSKVLATMSTIENRPRTLEELLSAQADVVERAVDSPRPMLGVQGALSDVSAKLRGYQPGKFVIVAGRPGMGKSAYMLSDALALAKRFPVLFFTLEMPADEVLGRILQNEAGMNIEPLLIGKSGADGYARYLRSIGTLTKIPLIIDDSSGLTPSEIEARINIVRGETGLKLGAVVIDYIQLINARAEVPKNASREQEISHISQRMKTWAKRFGVTVIAASQLSRAVEARADKRPLLSDLRESGALEQDADIVQMLYRDSYYHNSNGWVNKERRIAEVEVDITKHRGGETGTVYAAFDMPNQRFVGTQRQAVR